MTLPTGTPVAVVAGAGGAGAAITRALAKSGMQVLLLNGTLPKAAAITDPLAAQGLLARTT